MKIYLLASCLICVLCCDTKDHVQDAPNRREPEAISGHIYSSKTIFFLKNDSLYIEAKRLSSFEPAKATDTLNLEGGHVVPMSLHQPRHQTSYEIHASSGEQLHFITGDSVKVWLRESSTLELSILKKRVSEIMVDGEANIESQHKVIILPRSKCLINLKGQSEVSLIRNTPNFGGQEQFQICPLKGSVQVTSDYPEAKLPLTTLNVGQEFFFYTDSPAYKIQSIGDAERAMWRNANVMRFSDASLATIFRALDDWYRIQTIYDSLPDDKINITIPYATPLDSVIKSLNALTNVKLLYKKDTSAYVLKNTYHTPYRCTPQFN